MKWSITGRTACVAAILILAMIAVERLINVHLEDDLASSILAATFAIIAISFLFPVGKRL